MKKTIALFTMISIVLTCASCDLVRKIDPAETAKLESEMIESEKYETSFSETESTAAAEEEIRYTEEEAYEFLNESLKLDTKNSYSIEKTGDVLAQSNGNEYYIFNVTKSAADDDENSPKESEETTEAKYYVSTNGIIVNELTEANITSNTAAETYTAKHGENDPETGFLYRLEYAGVVKNQDAYCYNFKVYLEDNSSGNVKSTYKTNYLVSLDGRTTGETVLEQN